MELDGSERKLLVDAADMLVRKLGEAHDSETDDVLLLASRALYWLDWPGEKMVYVKGPFSVYASEASTYKKKESGHGGQ
jgi:hypothetical protein